MKESLLIFMLIFHVSGFTQGQFENEKIDTNSDGEPDYFIEYSSEDGTYYELIDSNFDGRIDESWKLVDGEEVSSGKVDSDFDGFLETEYISDGNQFTKILSDSNKNGIHDIFISLKNGSEEYAERFHPATASYSARIGRIEYIFSYPTGNEVFRETNMTESQFETSRLTQ